MTVKDNAVYTKDGKGTACQGTVHEYPSDEALIEMGLAALRPFPKAAIVGKP